mmetsp:Transcript_17525/g.48619  ORF Transcript_17525/g.48619 Transcript_17525/m.48619 type:complete len:91 (+) Transcript_17525:182-454(+)
MNIRKDTTRNMGTTDSKLAQHPKTIHSTTNNRRMRTASIHGPCNRVGGLSHVKSLHKTGIIDVPRLQAQAIAILLSSININSANSGDRTR